MFHYFLLALICFALQPEALHAGKPKNLTPLIIPDSIDFQIGAAPRSTRNNEHVPFKKNKPAKKRLIALADELMGLANKTSFMFGDVLEKNYDVLPALLEVRHKNGFSCFKYFMSCPWYSEHFSTFWNLFFRSYRAASATNDQATHNDLVKLMRTFDLQDTTGSSLLDIIVYNFGAHKDGRWVIAEILDAYTYCFPNKQTPPCSQAIKMWLRTNRFIAPQPAISQYAADQAVIATTLFAASADAGPGATRNETPAEYAAALEAELNDFLYGNDGF